MIQHHFGKSPAYAYLPLRLPKQKEPGIGELVSSVKITCEFLAMDGWQIEGSRVASVMMAVARGEYAKHLVSTTDLLRESRSSCHSRHTFRHNSRIMQASNTVRMSWGGKFLFGIAPR